VAHSVGERFTGKKTLYISFVNRLKSMKNNGVNQQLES